MFRRVANVCAARGRVALTATLATASASPLTPPQVVSPLRWASTEAPAMNNNSDNNSNANRRRYNNNNNNNANRRRRAAMPPAFDIVHWNDADTSRGHLLRVLHRNGYIVLDYHRQRPTTASTAAEAESDAAPARRENRAEKVVTVTLPPVYVARFLGVLEGRMEKVEVQSRFTNASFVPSAARGPHHYTLHCTSMKPATGQAQTLDGADVHEETVEWTVDLDPVESLMLHRFLTQALHYNSGFGRHA